MPNENGVDAQAVLGAAKLGLWRGEFEDGKMVRLYADDMMNDLLGTDARMTPEERCSFFATRIHPDDSALFEDYVSKITEVPTEIVYRYIHPQRGEYLVRCGGSRDPAAKDRVCILGVHRDISDIVRLEKARFAEKRLAEQNITLRKEQEQKELYYRELLDAQNCGLMVYTYPERKIIHMNAEARRIFHVSGIEQMQRELRTKLLRAYYPDPTTPERLHNLRLEDGAVDYECVLSYGTPDACHIMAKTKTFLMPGGEHTIVTTFLDVSDMVTLRDALRKAQEGSRAKSSFLFAMSHDLRTPMNAIIGYADLIQSNWGSEEVCREYLKKLKEASGYLLSLIGNVLEVSRIESGKESLHEIPWDLRHLEEALDILEGEIAKKQLTVTSSVTLPQPYVSCDATKVQEILMNLLSNAVKYTPNGGHIAMTLGQRPGSQADSTVLTIRVQDDGIGIAKEFQPHLFEAFSRERDSSQSGIMGTGLGLQIVKSFVSLMGGTVTVDSTPGKGSCFTVELPLQQTSPESIQRPKSTVLPPLEGKRVLLAEDNALNAEITSTILHNVGMLVDTAENGAVALSMLQAVPAGYYDLILMDIQMPCMNGYEATRAIRALHDGREGILIIAMTANAFEEDRQAAFAAGMDDYASKPIEPVKLERTIAEALARKREQQGKQK